MLLWMIVPSKAYMHNSSTIPLHEHFIPRLAEYLDEHYIRQGKDLSRVCIVFGGRRPALFLQKELANRQTKASFSPRFFSIDEFIAFILRRKEPIRYISDLDACFLVYQIAQRISPEILENRREFSHFLPWARQILQFIEQVDLEDIPAERLENIQAKAEIGFDVPDSINALLKNTVAIRSTYQEELVRRGLYSRGFMYRKSALEAESAEFPEFDEILFCGFFYMHETEKKVVKALFSRGIAKLFFQGDSSQWSVLEKLGKDLGVVLHAEETPAVKPEIIVQAGFDTHSQVSLVREALADCKDHDKTVVVLADPQAVIPLLSEISSRVENCNVSIGYPLTRSSLYTLFQAIFKAQMSRKENAYYAPDYLHVLAHPLVKNLFFGENPSVTRILVHKVEEILVGMEKTELSGSLFIQLAELEGSRELFDYASVLMKKMDVEVRRQELKTILSQLHEFLFSSWEKAVDFVTFAEAISRVLDTVTHKSNLNRYPLNMRMAEKLYEIRDELVAASFSLERFDPEDLFRIFENKLANEMINFSGSPLAGLQVLGLFETRSLNFENVIIMDVNESVLPNLTMYEPLIPREIMIGLGLNRLEKEEEIQRYLFRRLIASAKNVRLIYKQCDEREKSRFLEEIIWEKQRQAGSLDAVPIARARFSVKVTTEKSPVAKKPGIIAYLRGRTYSASSVNTYLTCPMRFYFQYVLGLQEKEDLLDEPEAADIGTFLHEFLEMAYTPYLGKKPCFDKTFEKDFFERFEEHFEKSFRRKMKSDAFLLQQLIEFRLKKFLENERRRDIAAVISVERELRGPLTVTQGDFDFRAFVDRIDRLSDGSILIIDYKTGSTSVMPHDIRKIEEAGFNRQALRKTLKSFQLPIYLYFVRKEKFCSGAPINAALYSLRDMDKNQGLSPLFRSGLTEHEQNAAMDVYLKALDAILSEILNPDIPFVAEEDSTRQCAYCPFGYMCR